MSLEVANHIVVFFVLSFEVRNIYFWNVKMCISLMMYIIQEIPRKYFLQEMKKA